MKSPMEVNECEYERPADCHLSHVTSELVGWLVGGAGAQVRRIISVIHCVLHTRLGSGEM